MHSEISVSRYSITHENIYNVTTKFLLNIKQPSVIEIDRSSLSLRPSVDNSKGGSDEYSLVYVFSAGLSA